MRSTIAHRWAGVVVSAFVLTGACDKDDGDEDPGRDRPENTGAACEAPTDCYPSVEDPSLIEGEVQCLDRVEEGYCTHLCETDDDCCSVEGECEAGVNQVCSPFESTDQLMCFLSCEADVIGEEDELAFCQNRLSTEFICRSSGGGSDNRKVCVPGNCGVGESCAADADCATGLTCITELQGGYCSERDCAANADCPENSLCVDRGDGLTLCMRTCTDDGDCAALCRDFDVLGTCAADAVFAETGTTGSVCVPPG